MDKYTYKIYGLVVETDIELEEAFPIEPGTPDIIIRKNEIVSDKSIREKALKQTDKELLYRNSQDISEFYYKTCGSFLVENARLIRYSSSSIENPGFFNQIILGKCIPTAMIQRREIALHGSCVYYKNKAVVVSGESGAGKSSFTSEFLLHGDFMSDDTVRVTVQENKCIAHAGYPQRKICEDTLRYIRVDQTQLVRMPDFDTEKYAIRNFEDYHYQPEDFGTLIVIRVADIDEVAVTEIFGSEKLKYVIQNLYQLNAYQESKMLPAVFSKCVKIANDIKVLLVERPAKGMTVKEQVGCVLGRLE